MKAVPIGLNTGLTLISSKGFEHVSVFVGKEEQEFYLCNNRAAAISNYFRQAFELASSNNNKIWLKLSQ